MIARGLASVAAPAVVALLAMGPSGAFAQSIGVAAATQNEVAGVQAGATRALIAGSQVFQEELIRTGVQSMAQLLFLDETTLSIGPQSTVVLDRFVFNPATGAGSMVLSTTVGAFRFITGSQNPSNYEIKTPFASIGVRGTIVDFQSTPAGVYATAQEGTVILVVGGVEYILNPGEALYIDPNGNVTGPFTPDGEFFNITGLAAFPLYGGTLPNESIEVEVEDGGTILVDELFDFPDPCPYGDCEYSCYDDSYECGGL